MHGFFTIMHCFVIQSVLYGLCACLVATCNEALNFHAAVFEHAKRFTNIPYRRICKYQHMTLDWLSAFVILVLQLMTICVNSLHFVACIRTRAPLVRRDCTEWWKTTLTSILWQKTAWPCGFGGWKGCKRRHFNNHAVWIFIIFLIRIGEAQNPGPDLTNEELKIFHCNIAIEIRLNPKNKGSSSNHPLSGARYVSTKSSCFLVPLRTLNCQNFS